MCPYAPCHNHEFRIPEEQCKDSSFYKETKNLSPVYSQLGLQWCCAIAAISPKMILDRCELLLGGHISDRHTAFLADKGSYMPKLEKEEVPKLTLPEMV